MKNRIRKTLDFPGLFPTPATDDEVVFESTTSTIPSHRRLLCYYITLGCKMQEKIWGREEPCRIRESYDGEVTLRKTKELTIRNCLTDGEERTIMGTMVFIGKRKLEETL